MASTATRALLDIHPSVREACNTALIDDDIRGGMKRLRELVKEEVINSAQQRTLTRILGNPKEGEEMKKVLLEDEKSLVVAGGDGGGKGKEEGEGEEEKADSTKDADAEAGGSLLASALSDPFGTSASTSAEEPSESAEATGKKKIKSKSEKRREKEAGLNENRVSCIDPDDPDAPIVPLSEEEIKHNANKYADETLGIDTSKMSEKDAKRARRDAREAIIADLMRKRRWPRSEAYDFVKNGGLEAEKQDSMMPHNKMFDDMLQKGPPEWFQKAMDDAQKKGDLTKKVEELKESACYDPAELEAAEEELRLFIEQLDKEKAEKDRLRAEKEAQEAGGTSGGEGGAKALENGETDKSAKEVTVKMGESGEVVMDEKDRKKVEEAKLAQSQGAQSQGGGSKQTEEVEEKGTFTRLQEKLFDDEFLDSMKMAA